MALLATWSALQLACTLAVLLLATGALLWRRTARRLRVERALAVRVERDPAAAAKQRAGIVGGSGLLAFLELDRSVADSPPLKDLGLISLADYFASLVPQGPVSWERAVVSIADRFGLTAALPLALFLPNGWRREACAGGLLASFPSLAASAFVNTAISTLDLTAFGQTVHLNAARQAQRAAAQGDEPAAAAAHGREADQGSGAANGGAGGQRGGGAAERTAAAQLAAKLGPLDILRLGRRPPKAAPAAGSSAPAGPGNAPSELPCPLLLTRESVLAVVGLSEEEAADPALVPAPEPRAVSPLLPDLYLGAGGLTLTKSRYGAALCGLMATVLNRLTANALLSLPPELAPPPMRAPALGPEQQQRQQGQKQQGRFTVRLEPGGPELDSVEGLLGALAASGHSVHLRLTSNITSFGVGLNVRGSGGGWQQIPLAYPLRLSGLWARDERGQPVDVLTLIAHAAIYLEVRGAQLEFELEWCLSIEGFTGWLSGAFVQRQWANGEDFRNEHPLCLSSEAPGGGGRDGGRDGDSGAASPPGELGEQQRRLARLLTCSAVVLNLAAQQDRLLFGGYGHIGVCVDSVATVQQALTGRCTLFPLILSGEAKMRLMALHKDAQRGGCWEYAAESEALQRALGALPCDAVQEPRTAAAAARRALACLPLRSAFAAVAACRTTLEAAFREAEALCPEREGT